MWPGVLSVKANFLDGEVLGIEMDGQLLGVGCMVCSSTSTNSN